MIILMDTEGLGSTERTTNIDMRIFTLSVMLASTFVYNQIGPISEVALEEMGVVAGMA